MHIISAQPLAFRRECLGMTNERPEFCHVDAQGGG